MTTNPLSADLYVHLGLPTALAQQLVAQEAIQINTHSTSNGTLAAGVASGASNCIVQTTATGANTVTLRTAAQMFTDVPGLQSGFAYTLTIYNSGTGTATLTAPDANTTITGTAAIPSNTSRAFAVTFTSATTMTLVSVTGNLTTTTVGAQLYPVGYRTNDANGNVYMYGQAAMVISQFDFVTIDTNGNINSLMPANVLAGQQIGVAQTAFTATQFGFICISGIGLLGNVVASAQINVPVIASPTTGRISTTSGVAAGVPSILGVNIVATAGLTATATSVALTSPVLKL
jgi:hypothetical protein